jgi:hypothetical protein
LGNRGLKMRNFFLNIFLFIAVYTYSQRIQNFNVFSAGTSVGLKFTIAKGVQCSGYIIWHSTDSINFSQLYNFPGICGDVTIDQDYSYTHTFPAQNQINYYKVELQPLIETSPVKRIYVSNQLNTGMQVFPNPVVNFYDMLNIKILNSNNTRVTGFLYNQFGKPMRFLDLKTVVDLTSLNISELSNGLYMLWLTEGASVYSSKFIVNR